LAVIEFIDRRKTKGINMECSNCSVDGKKLVHMETKFDKDNRAKLAICPECGKEEIVGFGHIR
jgi:uncharacterized Zn finger protein